MSIQPNAVNFRIFTKKHSSSNAQRLKYQICKQSGCKDLGIGKFKFLHRLSFFHEYIWPDAPKCINQLNETLFCFQDKEKKL